MSASNLRRMVLRVPEDLRSDLVALARRLHDETGLVYPAAAIVRGILVVGLAHVVGLEHAAPTFVGARLKRGVRKGHKRAPHAPDDAPTVVDIDRERRRRDP